MRCRGRSRATHVGRRRSQRAGRRRASSGGSASEHASRRASLPRAYLTDAGQRWPMRCVTTGAATRGTMPNGRPSRRRAHRGDDLPLPAKVTVPDGSSLAPAPGGGGDRTDRAGFEPAVPVNPTRRFSKPVPSATRPPVQPPSKRRFWQRESSSLLNWSPGDVSTGAMKAPAASATPEGRRVQHTNAPRRPGKPSSHVRLHSQEWDRGAKKPVHITRRPTPQPEPISPPCINRGS